MFLIVTQEAKNSNCPLPARNTARGVFHRCSPVRQPLIGRLKPDSSMVHLTSEASGELCPLPAACLSRSRRHAFETVGTFSTTRIARYRGFLNNVCPVF